ncbi:three component ABC system middle component [Sulfuricella sp.]|uniref:three component ABC system middle component n=1 Tax=Sulfuricella sp. TaxID=2099377 RepID=UPI002BF7C150|nr:three component ABC system middle component [Sulfuricella sp.]HUX63952.1 three component ABC system middle component [Sulfuricella sp.]
MTAWHDRTIEERNLLNPAFCAVILWFLAKGYRTEADALVESQSQLPLALAFVGSSFVLRGQTRRKLPTTIRTSLPSWVCEHPLDRSAVAKGVEVLRPYVREAIMFGSQSGLLGLTGTAVMANGNAQRRINKYVRHSTPEVQECASRAEFVGRWLMKCGTPSTVLSLLGMQP